MIFSGASSQAGLEGGPERIEFMPTPRNIETAFEKVRELPNQVEFKERIADMDAERISTLLQSVEGQEELCDLLINQHDSFQQVDVNFDPEELKSHVELVGATLKDMQEYDELIRQVEGVDPEAEITVDTPEAQKKLGLFRRALGSVGGFAKKHPIVTTVLAAGLVSGSVAGVLYLSGYLSAAQAGVAAEAIHEFIEGTGIAGGGIGEMPGFNPLEGVPLGK
ncbi:hypothetical protein KKF55_02285 [Patescibacteria group bacterium]|nr:hypothetical protein [Patescibacteria group bacterium]